MAERRHPWRHPAALPLTVAAVAALVAAVTALTTLRQGGSAGAVDRYGDLAGLARRTAGDPTARGARDAPVVLVAYSDFQCPFCGRFARDTEPALVREYVDTGVLRIEWRDFPYLGKESVRAARAARAAAQQGKFWPYHDELYAHQAAPNSGSLTEAYLTGLADRLGLDTGRFRRDLHGPLVAKLVQHDFDEGMTAGVTGTPAFLVNGRPIMGAQPLHVFEKAIDRAAHDR